MKKNPQDEKEESLPSERPEETKIKEAGSKSLKFVIYALVLIGLVLTVYFITRYSNDTFRINM